jgi:hypothetical protein
LRITIELGVRRLDARGDSQLVIDQVMKNSHCRDPKMEAYCDEVRRLEDKFYGLEVNHVARRYNETADELAKIASGRTTVPPYVFSRDLHQPSVKTDDMPEPEKASAQLEAPSAQPEAPSAPKGEALRVEEERNGVPPSRDWQTPYLQYLRRGELPSVVWSLRTTPSRATGFTPFFLVYGAEAILPTHLEYGSPRARAYDDQSNRTNREDSLDQLEEARDIALLHSARYQQSLRRYHARGIRSRDLQVGDLVLRLRQDARGRHKLTPPWEGPFIIAKIVKPGTYKLANSQGEVYSNAWNIRQLCRFYP